MADFLQNAKWTSWNVLLRCSFCCEIICSNSCFLKFDLLPYCWKPFKFQEVLTSRESHKNVQLKHILSRWIHFQNVSSSWELQQIRDLLYVGEIAKKTLSTLFIFNFLPCLTLFRMYVRDTAAEKELDIETVWNTD